MDPKQVIKEVIFKAVRSGGAGGQHVNKVSTKVILIFDPFKSEAFSNEEKDRLIVALKHRLNKDNKLIVQASDTRSQTTNREIAQDRLLELLTKNLEMPKKRKKTKPRKSAKEKRLKSKKLLSEKKSKRRKPDIE